MQFVRNFDDSAIVVGWGVSAVLLTDAGERGKKIGAALWGLGAVVDWQTDIPAIVDDTALIVIDCDAFGGIDAGQAILRRMTGEGTPLAAVLISGDVSVPQFPEDRDQPVQLRGPVSVVALRVGFEHALRTAMQTLAA